MVLARAGPRRDVTRHLSTGRGGGTLVRITAPHFCAGLVVGDYYAPVIAYMRGWDIGRITTYCHWKGWRVEVVNSKGEAVEWFDGVNSKK